MESKVYFHRLYSVFTLMCASKYVYLYRWFFRWLYMTYRHGSTLITTFHPRDRYRFSLTFWAPSLWSNLHRKSSFRSNFLPWVLPTNVNDWLHPEKVWCESIPFSNLNPIYLYLFCLNFYLRLFKRLYQHSRTNYNREWT